MRVAIAITLLAAGIMTSCETKTQSGALVGAGAGALAGGLIGGGTGAVIGGAAGAAGGALIGYAMDESDRRALQQQAPQTLERIDRGQPLTLNDIVAMSQAGIQDEVIMSQIDSTGTAYRLSTQQIIDLKNAGVSQRVIDYMIQTGTQYP